MSARIETVNRPGCSSLDVPVDVCSLRFASGQNHGSKMLEFTTARGETLIGDFDDQGRLLRIELLGSSKPCQQG